VDRHGNVAVLKLDVNDAPRSKTPDGVFLINTPRPELWILEAKPNLTVRHGRRLS